MSLIKCPECGKEVSDKASKCINCGFPLDSVVSHDMTELFSETKMKQEEREKALKKKDFMEKMQKKKSRDKKIFIGVIAFFFVVLAIAGISESDENADNLTETTTYKEVETTIKETEKPAETTSEKQTTTVKEETTTKDNKLHEGDYFLCDGLMITINEIDSDFKNYKNDYGWNTPKDGMKYVMASFTFENHGKSDEYVSIYDFKCYADNTVCDQVYGLDDNDFINVNLSPGRNVSYKVYYSVPANSENIELEYELSIWTGKKIVIQVD